VPVEGVPVEGMPVDGAVTTPLPWLKTGCRKIPAAATEITLM